MKSRKGGWEFDGCKFVWLSLEAIPVLSNHKSLEKLLLERYYTKLAGLLVDVSGQKHLEKLVLSSCSNLSVLP
ncbi:hypothetical protein IGI04_015621 [Brassica rapa subsp. trilocularis]|uniref:NB-ARC domain-containing protein n=1 Tax=Brassica rapa subsp. trilocularis TaxID=1813537 RepID=A0ABQ7MQK5_BRACM|nr:hypothetical protein IGI04_015621 [Brassica rapa subsp. trilocularis]